MNIEMTLNYLRRNGVWIGFLILVFVMSIATNGDFLSARNLTNLLRQASLNGILAAGMTLVILIGGIDLSVGSVAALAGIFAGISQVHWGWAGAGTSGAVASFFLAVGVGLFSGFVTGALLAILRIAPFVITLGAMVIARGLALIFSNGASISPMGENLIPIATEYLSLTLSAAFIIVFMSLFIWGNRKKLIEALFPILTFGLFSYSFLAYRGFPILVLFMVAAMGLVAFLLSQTSFGRSVYSIGSNEKASQWAGVPVRRVTWIVYTLMGLFAGITGVLLSSRLNGADPNAGQLFELDAIAAVVIGGTSLKGGVGTIMGTLIGTLVIATLNNGMDLLSVPSFYQMVFKGIIIIVAVSVDKGQRQTI